MQYCDAVRADCPEESWLSQISEWQYKATGRRFSARTLDYARAINIACNRAVGRESEKGVCYEVEFSRPRRSSLAFTSSGESQFANAG